MSDIDYDVFKGYGVEITLHSDEDFLKIKETLTRIGIASKRSKTLFQSCHIVHKNGRYAVMHFKERFASDGKPSSFTEDDRARRNSIAAMLASWNLCTVIDESRILEPRAASGSIKVIKHAEKGDWSLVPKYTRWPT